MSRYRRKLPCMETRGAQSPKQVHMSPRWQMKVKWHTFSFEKMSFLMLSLVEARERFEIKGKVIFFITTKKFFFGQTYLLEKFWSHKSCKITMLEKSEMRHNGSTHSYLFAIKIKLTFFFFYCIFLFFF